MGLLKKFTDRILGAKSQSTQSNKEKQLHLRKCYFEVMEQRRVLSANSVIAGVTYLEGDAGQDTTPDHFEVTFEGGSDTTQMTQFTISGDQDFDGALSDGDMFFDVNDQMPGTGGHHAFQFDVANSVGITAYDIKSVFVSQDGLRLTVDVDNFEAGDKLAFMIDVDEVERYRVDKIASGVEFEGSVFGAKFQDDHYTFEARTVNLGVALEDGFVQSQREGIFFDEYDELLGEGERIANDHIDLGRDNEDGFADRTAAAIDAFDLVAKPVSISGTIYHDENLNCEQDAQEQGIQGVEVELFRMDDSTGEYVSVATTTTDADGNYEFGTDLNLKPGQFKLVEVQPDGYLDVGAEAGSHGGNATHSLGGDKNVIADIQIPLGGTAATDYDFKEVRPASLSGHVWHDANNDGNFDSNEHGIANVLIQVTRVGAKDSTNPDPFAGTAPIFLRTDSSGFYEVDALPPGIYEIIEINEYPPLDVDPLAAFLDGKDSVGNVDGTIVGQSSNDRFSQVVLCAGDEGAKYDFGEVLPAEISGTVWHDVNDNGVIESGEDRLGGVVIELFDKQGNKISETTTNAQGNYEFSELYPGEYIVRETQPFGFLDGQDSLGQIGGITVGEMTNDEFSVKLNAGDQGVQYNFGELRPSSISGTVHGDANGDCVFNPADGDMPLEGVELALLDANGNVLATTVTDQNGDYLFENLRPGTYSVREVTPDGYIDGAETVGQVDGQTRGFAGDDLISGIVLASGQSATNYDFCERIPAELCGTVYHDRNNNGVQDAGEEGIEGTRIVLTDENGRVVAETFTDSNGDYCFENLIPGTYCIKEIQPTGFIDGKDSVGVVNGVDRGTLMNDKICDVRLVGGEQGNEFNFGELQYSQISGMVHVDGNGNCVFDASAGERPLANVKLELMNSNGEIIGTTMTDANGEYTFDMLLPGVYSIRQAQPDGLFNGGETVGDAGGSASENLIENIVVQSGQRLTQYNFCEVEAAEIHGRVWADGPAIQIQNDIIPDDYRDQRDGVYNANEDTPISGVRVQLYYYVDPTNNSLVPRPVTLGEVQAVHYGHMGTTDPEAAVWVETNAAGQYSFKGLQAGNYIVLETQPEGYTDSNDTPGTTTGFTYNSIEESNTAPQSVLLQFANEQIMDAVVNVRVNAGGISLQNNFSEVTFVDQPGSPAIPAPIPPAPTPNGNPLPPSPGPGAYPSLAGAQPLAFTQVTGIITGRGSTHAVATPYTWHLSVVNAGVPRGVDDGTEDSSVWHQAGYISNADWTRFDMDDAVWTFTETDDTNFEISKTSSKLRFGMIDGIPLAGDFDGDGTDEVAVFKDGYWMIDINRNGHWDESDLLARLGDFDDQPVVGDWDGDGKDDIGIYGPMWEHDPEAIAREPGLPNPDNVTYTRPKNVPPVDSEGTNGARTMKLTTFGKQRADVVDHVFGTGESEEIPVAGDWNGNGIRSIGTFKDGVWKLDVNGDGRFDRRDISVQFGRAGDQPVVGDFNGDGIEEIAVYRSGTWMIDINGNRELDATDKTFEMGGVLDKPVVGDWDGDGIDEPGLYTERPNNGAAFE